VPDKDSKRKTLRGLFITGTDTGVGKTAVGTALTRELYRAGDDVQPRKPVESGCRLENGVLIPTDGLAYHLAVDRTVTLETITPYRFAAPWAPPYAARLEKQSISILQLDAAVRHALQTDHYCIVEGAGGFYSPIAEDGLNADLARVLGLPVLLVAADRLGCINHVLLSLQAIESRKLVCAAIVLNECAQADLHSTMHHADELKKLTTVPIIRTGFVGSSLPVNADALLDLIPR
jgi:dethiobiotin synthetase